MLTRKILVAAESGESEKFKGLFKGRQPGEIREALTDTSQERYNEALGNVRFTPLIAGAWYGHINVVDELLTSFKDIVDINQVGFVNYNGKKREVTALCAAIRTQNLDMAQHLLDLGAKIEFCNPLIIACHRGDVISTRFLLKKNANINGQDHVGTTCLMAACEKYSLYVVRLLLDNGADVRLADHDGNTPLHRLALKQRMVVLKGGPIPQIVDALVNAGALMSRNNAEQTPLDVAVEMCNLEVARALMSMPEVRPEEQLTAQAKLHERLGRKVTKMRRRSDNVNRFGQQNLKNGAEGDVTNGVEGERKGTRSNFDYQEPFVNPIQERKMRKSKSVAEKITDVADQIANLANSLEMDITDLEKTDKQGQVNGASPAPAPPPGLLESEI